MFTVLLLARLHPHSASLRVGLPGIEPGLHPPHGRVLPVYYSPHQGQLTMRPAFRHLYVLPKTQDIPLTILEIRDEPHLPYSRLPTHQ